MEKKRTITIYNDLNEPDRELIWENARKSPEELWKVYIAMRRLYIEAIGKTIPTAKVITIARPSWM